MVDKLANDYASQPVVFLEYDVDNSPFDRVGRFWDAFGGSSAGLPLIMIDSGHQYSTSYRSYDYYKSMVDAELTRPPNAAVTAYAWRDGTRMKIEVQVKNLSGVNLSTTNYAKVHAIIWEDNLPDAATRVTSRYVRSAQSASITTLANGASATYAFETPDLTVENWANIHVLALVDYRPNGSSGNYDMLQAGFGGGPVLQPSPSSLGFLIDTANPTNPTRAMVIGGGPSAMTWTASESLSWLTVTPGGPTGGSAAVQINSVNLANGLNSGTITFNATFNGTPLQQLVQVKAFYGTVLNVYLPGIMR